MKGKESTYFLIGIAVTALALVMVLGVGSTGGVMAQISIQPTPTSTNTPISVPTATNTPAPPTSTNTPLPPTPTATSTPTPIPPTPTNTPTSTPTPIPPTPTPANLPPVVTVDQSLVEVDEGSTATNSGTVSDPDGSILALSAYAVGSVTASSGTWSWTYTPLDGPDDSGYVTIEATDNDGATSTAAFVLAVSNVAPEVGAIAGPTAPAQVDTELSFTVAFTDPGALDIHTFFVDWGDGSTCTSGAGSDCPVDQGTGGVGSVTAVHVYDEPGVYAVTATVTDNDGDSGTSVFEYAVVYDPDHGYVTGGGWFDSPPGAYKPDPLATGTAGFGFYSRNKRGATLPVGKTIFQFQAGYLYFKSDHYDWLVVNRGGARAQFKGAGTVNGQLAPNGDLYKFMIWAEDGSPDTIRVKIWYESGGEIPVYDNGVRQPIVEGDIVVRKTK